MRNATKEEIESTDAYINNISETMISLSELQKIRQEIDKLAKIHSDGEFYIKHFDVAKLIDTHISTLSGKEQK